MNLSTLLYKYMIHLHDTFFNKVRARVLYKEFQAEQFETLREYYLENLNSIFKLGVYYLEAEELNTLQEEYLELCDNIEKTNIQEMYENERNRKTNQVKKSSIKRGKR